jgi:hypothetical protein
LVTTLANFASPWSFPRIAERAFSMSLRTALLEAEEENRAEA